VGQQQLDRYPGRRLVAAFEPRANTSRRSVSQAGYVEALSSADRVLIRPMTDEPIYSVTEPVDDRFSTEQLAGDLRDRGVVAQRLVTVEEIVDEIAREARPGDAILRMINGSFEDTSPTVCAFATCRSKSGLAHYVHSTYTTYYVRSVSISGGLMIMAKAQSKKRLLTRRRILRAAVSFADKNGLEALNMRVIAGQLGAGVMSLYNHVATKDDLIDGMVDLVAAEIPQPSNEEDWRAATFEIAVSAQKVLMKHVWVSALWSSRGRGPAKLAHLESILRVLRKAGFPVGLACRAYHAITMHIVGFTLQAGDFPSNAKQMKAAGRAFLSAADPEQIPYFTEHVRYHVEHPEPGNAFVFALEMILDGLGSNLEEQRGGVAR
jgi:AcrR family transcriptional regulator